MNDTDVSQIRLPEIRSVWRGENLARRLLLKLFSNIRIGSLTVRDGEQLFRFGNGRDLSEPHAEITVRNPRAYSRILAGGIIASGESYILGEWTSPQLTEVIRLFSANMQTMQGMQRHQAWWVKLALKLAHGMNRNTHKGSRRNIAAHYDLGNDFFQLFLDPSMMYSSALFPSRDSTLEQAAREKLDEICRQLELRPTDHLLEIGTGWGGMAIHAARHYGCRVTTTTISREQYEYARQRVEEEGLAERVEVLCEDYRNLQGQYDKLVSIEMIEAVGHDFYASYFRKCSDLLQPDGKMVLQAITIADQRYAQARDSVDFIKRYIFPGGCLPSLAVIGQHLATDTDMQLTHLRDITEHYAMTLRHWRERFMARLDEVSAMGFDQQFQRMWEFYLSYCEGGFRERIISTVQLAIAKPGYRFSLPHPD